MHPDASCTESEKNWAKPCTGRWTVDWSVVHLFIGLARTIYIRCVYGVFGREITIYTVIYGVYIRFWPTLLIYGVMPPSQPCVT